jgi:hypothetical protein
VTAGAGLLPILDHAAALCVIDAGQLIQVCVCPPPVIAIGATFYDRIREGFTAPRPDDVSAVLR